MWSKIYFVSFLIYFNIAYLLGLLLRFAGELEASQV